MNVFGRGHLAFVYILEPAMNRELIKDWISLFDSKLLAKQSVATGRVHYHAGRDVNFMIRHTDSDATGVIVVIEQDFGRANSLIDLRSKALGVLQHQEIEFLAINMISIVLVDFLLRKFVERDGRFALSDRRMP